MFSSKSKFSCKSKFARNVIIFALFLVILIFGGCLSLIPEEDIDNSNRNSAEIPDDGYIRLVLNDKTGSFSLYFLSDPQTIRYEPLFNADEPLASFLSVNVDGNVYRLGGSRQFTTKIERLNGDPALVFDSPFVKVTQIFTPVKTSGSSMANGIMITIRIQNISSQRASIGVRMLLDTNLGEGRKRVPFLTNTQVVNSELLIEGGSGEKFWISRGTKTTLMGSIVNPVEGDGDLPLGKGPDLVHIANWKRLNDASWRLRYLQGRSFNNLPHSIGDSAVCYYFGPEILDRDKISSYTVFLTTEDLAWYKISTPPPHLTASTTQEMESKPAVQEQKQEPENQTYIPVYIEETTINIPAIEAQARYEATENDEDVNTLTLLKLQEILNQFINGQILLNEHDLTAIERAIERHDIRN
jgi:hypothetical protein